MFPIGPPPLAALGWLVLALLPVSALFSASALAIAAFARSTKEGQYYLMPLLLICLPLLILPLLPAVSLNLGTSLIPVSGIMLLLRGIVEGQHAEAAWFAPPVLLVTGACCLLATRWAVDQFNNESVLFRESERIDLALWLRHLVRDRGPTPTLGQACACGVLLLMVRFFASFAVPAPSTWREFAVMQGVTQVVLLAGPVLLLTALLTRSARATLLLRPVRPQAVGRSIVLAIALHPVAMRIAEAIQALYPLHESVLVQLQDLQQVLVSGPGFWPTVALLACLPAVCEELAFRGFILSGFRARGSKWSAMIASSVLFGATHGILQQSLGAALVGMVIAYLAVQTGSLLPGIAFHAVYNTLSLLPLSAGLQAADNGMRWWNWWLAIQGGSVSYDWSALILGVGVSCWILRWYSRLSPEAVSEAQRGAAVSRAVAGAPLT
jgi:sodium transport system permease protein